ncbi:MAG TPA: tetratricopeptide repeat protein [Tepidisphaeraceae bacterium]|jgi:tetratricopeptide (TPR) repeat protein
MTQIAQIIRDARRHQQSGRLNEAGKLIEQVLQLDPNNSEAIHYRGLLAQQHGDSALALKWLNRSVELAPGRPDFHNNLATVLGSVGRFEEALKHLDEALRLDPNYSAARANRKNALAALGRVPRERAFGFSNETECGGDNHCDAPVEHARAEEPIEILRDEVRLEPQNVMALLSLGNAMRLCGDRDAAIGAYRTAVELLPDSPLARSNLGASLLDMGCFEQAIEHLRKAISLNPDLAPPHFNLALALLASGDWALGWPEFEWRRQIPDVGGDSRIFAQPEWDGCPLRNRSILVQCEQGFGDTIQFVRFLPLLKDRGARVILECQPKLQNLLKGVAGADTVVARGEQLPPFDTHVRLLSLPGIFETTPSSIPASIPYLHPEPAHVEKWRPVIAGPAFKIGMVWQGRRGYRADRDRSIPLKEFTPLAQVPGVKLFSLQKEDGTEQIADCGFEIRQMDPTIDTAGAFVDTAAIIPSLDLVITSDTAIAHLAGAIGAQVWVALAKCPDWRWMVGRADSPWYPTMRLFRQETAGDWNPVFARMANELKSRARPAPQPTHVDLIGIPGSPAQLLDRIAILRIKIDHLPDDGRRASARRELDALLATRAAHIPENAEVARLEVELGLINTKLWDAEDQLRACERDKQFGAEFVELARSVYQENDRRAAIKSAIDYALGGSLSDVKIYPSLARG